MTALGGAGTPGTPSSRFATIVLDVDSTLSGIEGIDWLGARRGAETAALVHALTEDAMSGRVALEDAYALRLDRVAPTRVEVHELAGAYRANAAAGARAAIDELKRARVRVLAISGGLREAILPLCLEAGLADADVFAVSVQWDASGAYTGFDRRSPLTTQNGKATLLRSLALPRRILAIGDGSTDLAMRTDGAADAFAAYTEFVYRDAIVAAADLTLTGFDQLLALAPFPR